MPKDADYFKILTDKEVKKNVINFDECFTSSREKIFQKNYKSCWIVLYFLPTPDKVEKYALLIEKTLERKTMMQLSSTDNYLFHYNIVFLTKNYS